MNNNIKILYNNVDLFSGIAPTPFISVDQEYINFKTGWNQITKMSMNGQLTGRYLGKLSYYEITSGFNRLLDRLSNNYGTLVINENSENLFSGDNVIINSITTDQNSWYGFLPFTLNFEIYEKDLFNVFYGIVEPEENINFAEENGLIVNLTHTISAKGFKTGLNNAIENAKNWVKTRTGNYNKIIPTIVKTGNGSNFLLTSVKETVDRFNAYYQWQGNYVKSTSLENPTNALLNYNLDLSSGIEDGIISVKIDGSLTNNQITGSTSNNLRSGYFNYNFYNIANEASLRTFNQILNINPINQNISEQQDSNILNFSLLYNNDLSSNIINDYTITIDTDSIKNITTVNLTANISAKYGDMEARWNLVKDYYSKNFNGFSLANTEYVKEVNNRTLYPNALTESITFNEYAAEINYNASWSDKKNAYSDNVIQLTSSVKYTPSINMYVPNTSITKVREHNVQNINCSKRSILDINISATAKPNKNISFAVSEVNSELTRIKNIYNISSDYVLQNRNINTNSTTKTFSINEAYNYKGSILI
jgi:hypothetical protein